MAVRSTRADFDYVSVLGRGAWGCVYLAKRAADGVLYAVKEIPFALSPREQGAALHEAQASGGGSGGSLLRCLQRDALNACCAVAPRHVPTQRPRFLMQLLATLDSPHITRYYDSFLHEGRLHIVMEYCRYAGGGRDGGAGRGGGMAPLCRLLAAGCRCPPAPQLA